MESITDPIEKLKLECKNCGNDYFFLRTEDEVYCGVCGTISFTIRV